MESIGGLDQEAAIRPSSYGVLPNRPRHSGFIECLRAPSVSTSVSLRAPCHPYQELSYTLSRMMGSSPQVRLFFQLLPQPLIATRKHRE